LPFELHFCLIAFELTTSNNNLKLPF
jgi:hypothetical protein